MLARNAVHADDVVRIGGRAADHLAGFRSGEGVAVDLDAQCLLERPHAGQNHVGEGDVAALQAATGRRQLLLGFTQPALARAKLPSYQNSGHQEQGSQNDADEPLSAAQFLLFPLPLCELFILALAFLLVPFYLLFQVFLRLRLLFQRLLLAGQLLTLPPQVFFQCRLVRFEFLHLLLILLLVLARRCLELLEFLLQRGFLLFHLLSFLLQRCRSLFQLFPRFLCLQELILQRRADFAAGLKLDCLRFQEGHEGRQGAADAQIRIAAARAARLALADGQEFIAVVHERRRGLVLPNDGSESIADLLILPFEDGV